MCRKIKEFLTGVMYTVVGLLFVVLAVNGFRIIFEKSLEVIG